MPVIISDQLRSTLDSPVSLALQGPGGHGKSTILRSVRADEMADDAHLLDDARLRALLTSVEDGRRVAIAYRPWPRPSALAELVDAIRRRGSLVVLAPFTLAQTSAYVGDARSRQIHELTLGVPGLVARCDDPAVLPGLAAEIEHLPADPRHLLMALAAGVDLPLDLLRTLLSSLDKELTRQPSHIAELPRESSKSPDEVDRTLTAARATGFLSPDNRIVPIVRHAIAGYSPATQRDEVWQRLAELTVEHGGRALPLARALHGVTVRGGRFAALFEAGGDDALADDPALAARLFASAAAGGRPTASRQAVAAALSGQLDDALRIADSLVASDPSAASVAATALVHRGQLTRAAALYRWSGTQAFAAIAAAATGSAGELDVPEPDGPPNLPTLLDGASTLMAQGVKESLSGSPITAMSAFAQANNLLEPSGRAQPLPDSPAALAALVGLHCGEFGIGESMLDRALVARVGGPLLSRRHTLLKAWIYMVRGQTAHAAQMLSAPVGDGPLEPRDLLFAVGVEVGLARRNSDLAALGRAWERAREALIRHPVDLFTLLPLGELAIAAARLGESDRIGVHVREADALLEKLGTPALWATPWHWSRLHAAIVMEDSAAADEHMKSLASSTHLRYGAVLSAAAECWLELWRGTVDPIRVETAARALHDIGLPWDGARLAGQAAIRTSDRRAMTALLDCARVLQGRPTGHKGQSAESAPAPVTPLEDAGRLSDREQEVAQLVLSGMTYKQVGDQLFISAKTVEHHVARMRQRLNCSSRSELLARLRAMTNAAGSPIPAQRRPVG